MNLFDKQICVLTWLTQHPPEGANKRGSSNSFTYKAVFQRVNINLGLKFFRYARQEYTTRGRSVKKLITLMVATLASSLILYALVSKDQQARHSSLRTAALPKLIALHDMFATSETPSHPSPLFASGTKIIWQQGEAAQGSYGPRLSTPIANPDGPLPTVLVIDSGASGVSGPDIAQTVGFLVNRGYLVLHINCRHMNNAGKAAGNGMPDTPGSCTRATILNEAHELIERGIADPEALAVLGSGSGGTLALLAMSAEPGLFKAAIVHSPALYQADYLRTGAVPGKLIKTKVETSAGAMGLTRPSTGLPGTSPIELIGSLQGAVLMTHADVDTAAFLDRTHVRNLTTARKNVEIHDLGGGEEIYSRWQTGVQIARLTETFLADQLGGRDGGYDYVELLAKLF